MPKCMITTPVDFKATPVEAADPAFWQAALLKNKQLRIYLWPTFFDFKDNSEKAVYQTTPLGVQAVRDGRYDFEFGIVENLCLHKAMFTHRSISGRVFLLDVNNQLLGTADENDNFMGFSIMMLNTEKLVLSNGTVATQSPIRLVLADNLELDQNGALLSAAFINDLARLTDVTLTIVSASATKIVVKVAQSCDGTPVNGLVAADFSLKKADGTVEAITTASEVDGTYTLNGTGWLTLSVLTLITPDLLSIQAYETSPVTVTIPFP